MNEPKYSFALILRIIISVSQLNQITKVFLENGFSSYVYITKNKLIMLLAHTSIDDFLKESENNMIQKRPGESRVYLKKIIKQRFSSIKSNFENAHLDKIDPRIREYESRITVSPRNLSKFLEQMTAAKTDGNNSEVLILLFFFLI